MCLGAVGVRASNAESTGLCGANRHAEKDTMPTDTIMIITHLLAAGGTASSCADRLQNWPRASHSAPAGAASELVPAAVDV